jgi:Cu/Ag efflux protein CusF
MKKLILSGLIAIMSLIAMAQSPSMFNYQAVIRDANSEILVNQEIVLTVEILKSGPEGTAVFSEVHEISTNAYGLVNVKIGSVNPIDGVNFGDDTYFVRISVDGNVLGTTQLLSVPYAMHAKTCDNAFSGDYADLTNVPDLGIYLTDITAESLGDLSDVDLTNLADNQILKYDADLGKWIAVDVAAGSEIDPVFEISPAAGIIDSGSGSVITVDERAKLNGIEAGAEVNVNADWNALNGDSQILNKPTFSSVASTGNYYDLINIPAMFDGTWVSLTGKPTFASVATSGNYNDLTNTPDLGVYLTDINSESLGDLSDVDLTGLADNQILKYDAGLGKWIAIDVAAAAEIDPDFNSSVAANIVNSGSGYVITDAERNKLNGIQAGAELNVNADWNAVGGDAQILNKPSLSSVATSGNYYDLINLPSLFDGTWTSIAGKPAFAIVATSGNYSDLTNKPVTITTAQANAIVANTAKRTYPVADETKLAGIQAGAEVNVNSDWNAAGGDAQILNKPSFSVVATSGNYSDLVNLPSLFDGSWASLTGKPVFATVATSGNYNDLTNKPVTITTAQANAIVANTAKRTYPVADETKLAGIQTGAEVNVNADWNAVGGDAQILNKPSFSVVATSGNYNDLTNKPVTITTAQADAIAANTTKRSFPLDAETKLNGIEAGAEVNVRADWNAGTGDALILNKPILSTVATTGDYSDLTVKADLTDILTVGNNAGNVKIANLGTPTLDSDAATKKYVDDLVSVAGTPSIIESPNGLSTVEATNSYLYLGANVDPGDPTVNYMLMFPNRIDPHFAGENTFFGRQSGMSQNSATEKNTSFGAYSLNSILGADYNTAIGHQSGYTMTLGFNNTFVGAKSGYKNLNSYGNSYFGFESGYELTGEENTTMGYRAGSGTVASAGDYNVYVGAKSGLASNGSSNTAVGHSSLMNNTGSGNTALGYMAGFTGVATSGNVMIGSSAGYYETTNSKLYIANSGGSDLATGRTTALVYGDFSARTLDLNGTVKINQVYNLPSTAGTAGQVLTSQGGTTTAWSNVNKVTNLASDPTTDYRSTVAVLNSTKQKLYNGGMFTLPKSANKIGGAETMLEVEVVTWARISNYNQTEDLIFEMQLYKGGDVSATFGNSTCRVLAVDAQSAGSFTFVKLTFKAYYNAQTTGYYYPQFNVKMNAGSDADAAISVCMSGYDHTIVAKEYPAVVVP